MGEDDDFEPEILESTGCTKKATIFRSIFQLTAYIL